MTAMFAVLAFLAGAGLGALLPGLLLRRRLSALETRADALQQTLLRETERRSAAETAAARRDELESVLRAREEQADLFRREAAEARIELSRVREQLVREQESGMEKLALLERARSELGDAFKALSADALRQNNEVFLELARASLGRHQEQALAELASRTREIDQVVQPLHQSLRQVDGRIQELEQARVAAYATLTEQVRTLGQTQAQLQAETANLVRALRAPTARGRWGEIQLRRVVELAGMLDHCDFVEQKTVATGDRRLRPDMLIQLPNQRTIVVDAKTPLEAYLAALDEAEDSPARRQQLARHARQVRAHIGELSARSYWDQFQPAPELVVMFLPGESFFTAALEQDPALIEVGVEQRVLIATPTTLIGLLKAVAYGWRQEAVAQNAREISELGRVLYARVRTLAQHFTELRRGLDRTVDAFNKVVASLESRVLPQARKFRELGVGTGETIDSLDTVERVPRRPQSEELRLRDPTAPPE